MNIVNIKNRKEFRDWLEKNAKTQIECYIPNLKRGKPSSDGFYYLDAVEEALCFGWIDSVYKKVDDVLYQRFSPRKKNSNWTLLNIERCKRLDRLGLMTEMGREKVPKGEYVFDKKVINDIKKKGIFEQFSKFPLLYQKIKVFNLTFTKSYSIEKYKKQLDNLVNKTLKGETLGEWNDYGRLE